MNINKLHKDAWVRLQSRRAQLPHALLLSGHSGIGKFALAQAFVAGLLCEQPDDGGVACGQCSACHWLHQGNHPDLRWVIPEALRPILLAHLTEEEGGGATTEKAEKKASQEIKIDEIRALDSFLSVGTHRQGLRIVGVYPAEAMNRNTANAILKSLEEPAAGTLFLLISSNQNQLLPTIRSRCQVIPVKTPSAADSLIFLQSRMPHVQNGATLLAMAGGAPLLACDLAVDTQNWLATLLAALRQGAAVAPLEVAAQLDKQFKDEKVLAPLLQTVDWCMKWIIDLTLASQAQAVRYFIDQTDVIHHLRTRLNDVVLIRFYRETLIPLSREATQPLNVKLFLESLLSDYQNLFATTR